MLRLRLATANRFAADERISSFKILNPFWLRISYTRPCRPYLRLA
nr:MAG TPA: hypothetical protein [Caudoviricetes sp.]